MTDGIHVLHVDDDADVTELTAEMLSRELPNVRVTSTNDPNEVLPTLRDERISCVVSDYDMPDPDGLELLTRIRDAHAGLPFILYTAAGPGEVASQALSLGATDYVEKDGTTVQYDLLANRIENAVVRTPGAGDPGDGDDPGGGSYREIFERVNDAIFVHDIESGGIVDVNEKACELLDAPREEVLDYDVGDFSAGVEPYTQADAEEWIRRAATEGPQLFEWLAEDANGRVFWIEVNLKRTAIGDEERVLAVVRDATTRRRREEILDSLHASTRELIQARSTAEIAAITAEAAERVLVDSAAGVRTDDGPVALTRASSRIADVPPENVSAMWLREQFLAAGMTVYENEIGEHGRLVVGSRTMADWGDAETDPLDILIANAEEAFERETQSAKLRTERDRITALFENVSDAGVYVEYVDGEPIIRRVNPSFEEVFGYDAEDVLDRSLDDVVVPPGSEGEARELTEELLEGSALEREVRRQTATGLRDFLLRSTPLELHGNRNGSFGFYLDITERKERERTLEVLHEATREQMQARTAAEIGQITVETIEDVLDRPYAAIHLHDEETGDLVPAATTASVKELVGGDTGSLAVETGSWLIGGAFENHETQVYDAEDATLPVQIDDLRVVLAVPLGTRGVLSVGTLDADGFDEADVYFAELVAANAEAALERAGRVQLLREREKALMRERDRSEALFENVPDPAVRVTFEDGDPIIETVNSAFSELFGYDVETVTGESLDDYVVPPDRAAESVELNRTLQQGENVHAEVRRETVDGVRDFLLHVVPYKMGERSVQGYAIYTDITERKDHETTLTRQNERLEEFTSIVSHDLRNPLNIAQGFLSLARETGDDDHFDRVANAHDRMDRLIGELLDLARQGTVVGDLTRTELEPAAARAWQNVETGSAVLDVSGSDAFQADGSRLEELLENLFRNSVEHAGNDATVRVGTLDADAGFYVSDDGPGIDEEDRDRVFDSGYTTASNGTGFGLAIVERIAEAHGWAVSVAESAEGGARFEIRTEPSE